MKAGGVPPLDRFAGARDDGVTLPLRHCARSEAIQGTAPLPDEAPPQSAMTRTSALFVVGAGTEIGKTYVTAVLVRRFRAEGRRVRALKPLASGVPPLEIGRAHV